MDNQHNLTSIVLTGSMLLLTIAVTIVLGMHSMVQLTSVEDYSSSVKGLSYDTTNAVTTMHFSKDGFENSAVADGRKLAGRAGVVVESTAYDSYLYWLDGYVSTIGGYFEEKKQENHTDRDNNYRTLSAVIRVPVAELDDLLDKLALNGDVINQWENYEDITQTHLDSEAYLDSLRTEQSRLNELLLSADGIDSILEIERQLSDVRYKIENYERQQRSYDNQVAYATVSLDLTEVVEPMELERGGIFERCVSGLKGSLGWLSLWTQEAIVVLVGSSPFILVSFIVIFSILQWRNKVKAKRKVADESGNNAS